MKLVLDFLIFISELVMRKGFSRRSPTLPARAVALGLKSTWIGKWLSAAIAVPLCQ